MKVDKIKFMKGYKYQLCEDYSKTNGRPLQTNITGYNIDIDFIRLTPDGQLDVHEGYAWDGASGPTIDTPSSFRASLFHDALYQLMRMDLIGQHHRKTADILLRDLLVEDGMWKWRAKWWYRSVRKFARSSANAEEDRQVITAP